MNAVQHDGLVFQRLPFLFAFIPHVVFYFVPSFRKRSTYLYLEGGIDPLKTFAITVLPGVELFQLFVLQPADHIDTYRIEISDVHLVMLQIYHIENRGEIVYQHIDVFAEVRHYPYPDHILNQFTAFLIIFPVNLLVDRIIAFNS